MTRDELLDMLERLVREEKISTDEAAAILRAYDNGDLPPRALPLAPGQALPAVTAQISAQVYASTPLQDWNVVLGSPPLERQKGAVRLLDDFDAETDRFARQHLVGDGPFDARRWHEDMAEGVRGQILRNMQLGVGRDLNEEELARARELVGEQSGYLKRFAEEVSARKAAGRPMSEAQVASRSRMYAGVAYGEFYKQAESFYGEGYIVEYKAVDDGGTCSPCHEAEDESPYLPGDGPMPGLVCRGRGQCRCLRQREYDPEQAAAMRGREAVPA
jgi:hypothetical protein